MLFLAWLGLFLGIGMFLTIAWANGMSDAPGASISFWWVLIPVAISIALFVCRHFGWHPSW